MRLFAHFLNIKLFMSKQKKEYQITTVYNKKSPVLFYSINPLDLFSLKKPGSSYCSFKGMLDFGEEISSLTPSGAIFHDLSLCLLFPLSLSLFLCLIPSLFIGKGRYPIKTIINILSFSPSPLITLLWVKEDGILLYILICGYMSIGERILWVGGCGPQDIFPVSLPLTLTSTRL